MFLAVANVAYEKCAQSKIFHSFYSIVFSESALCGKVFVLLFIPCDKFGAADFCLE